MKITKAVVQQFEDDQQQKGTKTAIFNLLWLEYTEGLRTIGVTGKIKTSNMRKKRGKK